MDGLCWLTGLLYVRVPCVNSVPPLMWDTLENPASPLSYFPYLNPVTYHSIKPKITLGRGMSCRRHLEGNGRVVWLAYSSTVGAWKVKRQTLVIDWIQTSLFTWEQQLNVSGTQEGRLWKEKCLQCSMVKNF